MKPLAGGTSLFSPVMYSVRVIAATQLPSSRVTVSLKRHAGRTSGLSCLHASRRFSQSLVGFPATAANVSTASPGLPAPAGASSAPQAVSSSRRGRIHVRRRPVTLRYVGTRATALNLLSDQGVGSRL